MSSAVVAASPVATVAPALLRRAADTIRLLAADAVQKANSGHPGMPMGMADAAVVLWTQFLNHNPADPGWWNRDRFVLSAGHGSMLLYALLHLTGYDLPLAEIQRFRQWGSKTPGHPEYGLTPGVETTTGPLGQGIANAVGMALAERWLATQFNRPGFAIIDHHTYVIASDGDLMEGISHEVGALAGHLRLGKLIVLYDDNGISIDGPTSLTWSEDVLARFAAYGWHTQRVDGHDPNAVATAIRAAQAETTRPSLIACRTHIGFGSPNRQDSHKAHGEPLGVEEVRLTKARLGWPTDVEFFIPDDVREWMRATAARGAARQAAWEEQFARYAEAYPEEAAALRQAMSGTLPPGWDADLNFAWTPGQALATRAASGQVLQALASRLPMLIGGSADLTPSNNTRPQGVSALTPDDFRGRYIHFGVREHGMGAILNGMALHGGVRPYGGTFLVFSDYMRPAIRLAAMMHLPVIFVFTHDSIGVGEDGPTHQPIEHLTALRAIPNLYVFRPADATETAVAWRVALTRRDGPTALILTRQPVPVLEPKTDGADRGAYILVEAPGEGDPDVILMASGSEVHLAVAAARELAAEGVRPRVVSMPCWELFAAQPASYRQHVLPPSIRARVAVEAGATLAWGRYVGLDGAVVGLDRFGASAPAKVLYEQLGLTVAAVVAAARGVLGRTAG
jgi:transketolase